jgi:hypothetical protein
MATSLSNICSDIDLQYVRHCFLETIHTLLRAFFRTSGFIHRKRAVADERASRWWIPGDHRSELLNAKGANADRAASRFLAAKV